MLMPLSEKALELLALTRIFSLWRTLSVRILTDANFNHHCTPILITTGQSVRILTDRILQRENERTWAPGCWRGGGVELKAARGGGGVYTTVPMSCLSPLYPVPALRHLCHCPSVP